MTITSADEKTATASVPEALLMPGAKLCLYPFLASQKNAKDYFLMRLGCRTVTVLSTTHFGVMASQLLRKGCSPAEVSTRLSEMFRCEDVDIQPLLKALYKAHMIRSIDGKTVESEPPLLSHQFRQRLEWVRICVGAALSRAFIRNLPIPITHRAMCILRPKWAASKTTVARTEAKQALTSVLAGSLSDQRISSLARDFVEEQIRRETDLEFLSELPELEVGKWLRRYTAFQGLEHLDSALARGQGVLLSSFHFSSSHLLVLLLWLRGYSFTGAGGVPWKNHNRVLPSDNPELARALQGCGDVKWHATFTFQSALNICRTVNQGGMGLVFPDGIAARAKGDLATYFGHDAARYRRAQCPVPFSAARFRAIPAFRGFTSKAMLL